MLRQRGCAEAAPYYLQWVFVREISARFRKKLEPYLFPRCCVVSPGVSCCPFVAGEPRKVSTEVLAGMKSLAQAIESASKRHTMKMERLEQSLETVKETALQQSRLDKVTEQMESTRHADREWFKQSLEDVRESHVQRMHAVEVSIAHLEQRLTQFMITQLHEQTGDLGPRNGGPLPADGPPTGSSGAQVLGAEPLSAAPQRSHGAGAAPEGHDGSFMSHIENSVVRLDGLVSHLVELQAHKPGAAPRSISFGPDKEIPVDTTAPPAPRCTPAPSHLPDAPAPGVAGTDAAAVAAGVPDGLPAAPSHTAAPAAPSEASDPAPPGLSDAPPSTAAPVSEVSLADLSLETYLRMTPSPDGISVPSDIITSSIMTLSPGTSVSSTTCSSASTSRATTPERGVSACHTRSADLIALGDSSPAPEPRPPSPATSLGSWHTSPVPAPADDAPRWGANTPSSSRTTPSTPPVTIPRLNIPSATPAAVTSAATAPATPAAATAPRVTPRATAQQVAAPTTGTIQLRHRSPAARPSPRAKVTPRSAAKPSAGPSTSPPSRSRPLSCTSTQSPQSGAAASSTFAQSSRLTSSSTLSPRSGAGRATSIATLSPRSGAARATSIATLSPRSGAFATSTLTLTPRSVASSGSSLTPRSGAMNLTPRSPADTAATTTVKLCRRDRSPQISPRESPHSRRILRGVTSSPPPLSALRSSPPRAKAP